MTVEATLTLADTLIFTETGKHLTDLQTIIIRGVWQGRKYPEIAQEYGCTEGHAKDVAYLLWKLLSQVLGEKVSKSNLRSVLERRMLVEAEEVFKAPTPLIKGGLRGDPLIKGGNQNLENFAAPTAVFVGRRRAIAHLDNLIQLGAKVIVIQGEGGLGKTTLARQYLYNGGFELVLELLMAKETEHIASVESAVEEWLRKDFNEEPGREFAVTLARLKRHLASGSIGILIDNLEPALDRAGMFIAPHRAYLELLRVLGDSGVQSLTIITSRHRLCESAVNLTHYRLEGLEPCAWEEFFTFQQIEWDASIVEEMCRIYGGNAKAMGILGGSIREDFAGDLTSYWQENQSDPLVTTDLHNLVASQFERLLSLDPIAYRLLCRLGCYRDRDFPPITKAELYCLLWDVETSSRKQIITSLRNRSLLEYNRGRYWLHPVIRESAISRLRSTEEWEIVQQRIGTYWTEKITKIESVEDALTAWEAYYHYLAIEDFAAAARVILKSRHNQWGQYLPLGSTMYRMGLFQPVLTAIPEIINKIESERLKSELYNILGDLYWIGGFIAEAIATQEQTIALASEALNKVEGYTVEAISRVRSQRTTIPIEPLEIKRERYYWKMLEVDSLLSIGLYKIDLWELKEAANLFTQVIEKTTETEHYRWGQKASVCLALVNSYLGLFPEAVVAADLVYNLIVQEELGQQVERFAYFIQILGQTYVNLGAIDKGREMYEKAIAFAEESNYPQVKAKALTGLAEIYRQQEEFELGLEYHQEAIMILEKIGAKCDLAGAYFQLALTWHKMGEREKSEVDFAKAKRLFTEMKAPEQVKKVLAAPKFAPLIKGG